MPAFDDKTGRHYGRLVVLGLFSRNPTNWRCRCDCGETVVRLGRSLAKGRTKSCGCLNRGVNTTHGQSKTATWRIWVGVRSRCRSRGRYGSRGIGVDDPRWNEYPPFLADMGERPLGAHLHRIDNDLGYSKANCIWLTASQHMKFHAKSKLDCQPMDMTRVFPQQYEGVGLFKRVRDMIGLTQEAVMTPEEWKKVILKIEPRAKEWIVLGLADAMPVMVDQFKLDTALRQQHFLAQCAHESDHFQTTREYASGKAYEGRKDLGNTQKGDGERYRGRGLIQLTGRFNYTAASKALGEDYVGHPDLVERFPAAAIVSGWFWEKNAINAHADRDDIRAVTKVVNGGYNGLDSRQAALKNAKTVLV